MKAAVGLLLQLVKDPKKRVKIWQRAEKKMLKCEWGSCEKIVELAAGFKELTHPYYLKWFEFNGRKEKFEDIDIIIPDMAEDYLTYFFGDYMKLPPECMQIVRHHTVFIDLDNSYTQYKGKYYCIDGKYN